MREEKEDDSWSDQERMQRKYFDEFFQKYLCFEIGTGRYSKEKGSAFRFLVTILLIVGFGTEKDFADAVLEKYPSGNDPGKNCLGN